MDVRVVCIAAGTCLVVFYKTISKGRKHYHLFHFKSKIHQLVEEYVQAPAFYIQVALYQLYYYSAGASANKE